MDPNGIGVFGFPGRTNPKSRHVGELSVFGAARPCLHQLPSLHCGFKYQEQRYRQRYLDLMMNDSTRQIFETRAKVIRHLRHFMIIRGLSRSKRVSFQNIHRSN